MKKEIHLQLWILDKMQRLIKSVLSEIVEAVAIQADEGDEQGSDELSSTPPCSQMPHMDPYAHYEIR